MNGYWVGCYTGSNSGRVAIELDDRGTHFEGYAYAYDGNANLPSTFAVIKTPDKSYQSRFSAPLFPLHPQTGEPTNWSSVEQYFGQDISVPTSASVQCDWDDQHLTLQWQTDIGTFGSANLLRGSATKPSTYTPLPVRSWKVFKEFVLGLQEYCYIFRGQNRTLRLRTPFHRTGRGDMRRFMGEDVQTLHRHLSARTRHVFDLQNPTHTAAFLHLVQHHGYPTPLLDWTYSPFVAAYFAFRQIRSAEASKASEEDKVLVFIFDKVQWCIDFTQVCNLSTRWEHFSMLEPLALGNERLVPQQALSTFTTVDDIETYVQSKERERQKTYLQVIDLPMRERDSAARELRLMGITAGSLFPGLDGACEELRERFFRY
jgi:hypothetical protein